MQPTLSPGRLKPWPGHLPGPTSLLTVQRSSVELCAGTHFLELWVQLAVMQMHQPSPAQQAVPSDVLPPAGCLSLSRWQPLWSRPARPRCGCATPGTRHKSPGQLAVQLAAWVAVQLVAPACPSSQPSWLSRRLLWAPRPQLQESQRCSRQQPSLSQPPWLGLSLAAGSRDKPLPVAACR